MDTRFVVPRDEVLFAGGDADKPYVSYPTAVIRSTSEMGILYHRSRNHGADAPEAVYKFRTVSGSGNWGTPTGWNVSASKVTPSYFTQAVVTSDGDETGARTLTIYGKDSTNATVSANIVLDMQGAGEDWGASKNGTTWWKEITSCAVDGATAGQIAVGLRDEPSNICFRKTLDNGHSAEAETILFDGFTADGSQ